MTQPVIQVKDLSKCYQIRSTTPKPYHSLREDFVDGFKGLLRGKWGRSQSEDFWALKDVSFDVNQGEVVGIIGRNGAGKSTLLKILSRIVRPTSGEVVIRGRVGSLLEVGTGFHPELTGRENIFMNGAVLGMKRAEIVRKFDEIVAFAEVEKFLDTPVKFYSSGMYVRLAFAVAAHLEPEILIVDEVLAVGDAQFQKKCLGKMGEVAEKEGRTILFVSHNMNAISSLCDSAILVSQGQIVTQGSTPKVIERYFLDLRTENDYSDLSQYRNNKSIDDLLIYFTEIKFIKNNNQFLFKESINIEICFFSKISPNKISIGGGIYNALGNAVGTFITEEMSIEKNKSKTIKLSINNLHLSPAMYTLAFSIVKGNLTSTNIDKYDVVLGILQFEILPFNDQEKISIWNQAWGNLVLNDYIIYLDSFQ